MLIMTDRKHILSFRVCCVLIPLPGLCLPWLVRVQSHRKSKKVCVLIVSNQGCENGFVRVSSEAVRILGEEWLMWWGVKGLNISVWLKGFLISIRVDTWFFLEDGCFQPSSCDIEAEVNSTREFAVQCKCVKIVQKVIMIEDVVDYRG